MYEKVNVLVREAKQGDKKAVGELLHNMKPLILKIIKNHSDCRQTKEDMVQQGYLIAIECLRTFDGGKYKSYPRYMKLALYYGLSKRSKIDEILSLNSETGDGIEAVDLIEDTRTDVEEDAVKNDEYMHLRQAVEMLSVKQRYVIAERFFKARELKDIAAQMGISYSCIIKLQARAMANLKRFLTGGVN